MRHYHNVLMLKLLGVLLFATTNVQAQQVLVNEQPVIDDVQNVPLNAVSPQLLKDFVTVIDLIRREYYYPINDEVIFEDAMTGMLKGVDPYAEFLDEKKYENLQAFSTGDLAQVGIRAEYDALQNVWVISEVKKNSPAADKGIKPQSFLHQINQDLLSSKYSNYDIAQMLKGIAGTQVQLVVSNQGRRKRTISLQRNVIEQNKVDVTFNDGLVVIKLPVFQKDTQQDVLSHLSRITQPIEGVLIDIRDNPGGVLDAAVDIVGLVQESGGVVLIEDKAGNQELVEVISEESPLTNLPVVILQNRYSASASEVLASSLKLHGLATIVGETSYGKGSIQEVLPINDTQAIKLTVAHYLQADGAVIDGVGVKPDIYLNSNNKQQWLDDATSIIKKLMPTPDFKTPDLQVAEGVYSEETSKLPINEKPVSGVFKEIINKGQQFYHGVLSDNSK